jgi:hypothetical protein
MAGTLKRRRGLYMQKESVVRELAIEHNNVVDDIELVRAGARQMFSYTIEDLGAGADITARAIMVMPRASTVLDSVRVVHQTASAAVDGSNTLIITLRNITEGADVASVTKTATTSANGVDTLALVAAAADIAANDVLGLVVTQGASSDAGIMHLQFEFQPQTIDASGDMVAAKIGDDAGNAYTA